MIFTCKLDERFKDVFQTNINTLDKSRYHIDGGVEVAWSDERKENLPTVVFSLTRDNLYVKEIKRIHFNSYDEALRYLFDEKKILKKGAHMYPLFSNDLNPTHSESVWTNGINYGYYIFNSLDGRDYLKVKEKVGNWNKFKEEFLKVRKIYI